MLQSREFGENFVWGVSSSAYQTEGAYLTDGKGLSIWDTFTEQPKKNKSGQHAKVACNFYDNYIQDVILMDYLNIRNFRFSIAWSRILAKGYGPKNSKGIDYYNRLIDHCLENNITPWVTLYHWDLPQALENKGGWNNREILNWFIEYVETCCRHFGDRIHNWMVLNEPIVFTGAGYFLGIHAPGKTGLNNFLSAVHHAALCQALGGRIIKHCTRASNVGTTFSFTHIDPSDASRPNTEAAIRADALANRLFLEPLLGLGYPLQDLPFLQQLEKYMHPDDEKILKFDMDFIGVQQYTREVVKHSRLIPYLSANQESPAKRNAKTTAMGWEIYPEGMYKILQKLHAYPSIKNIIITENGAAFNDKIENGIIADKERIAYLESYLAMVLKARKEGVNVNGYFAWSFTDNFEWHEGFNKRFGLVYIDYLTQKRIIKQSGYWYKHFIGSHKTHLAMKGL